MSTEILPLPLLLLALFASVIALIGGIVFLYSKKLSRWLEEYGVPFAAGTMIVTALVGVLPEAVHLLGTQSYMVFLVAFIAAFGVERLLIQLHHHSDSDDHTHHGHSKLKTAVPMVLFGDTVHNFIDGVAIAAAYFANPAMGAITALSTFLHEVPHEIGDFSILRKVGWSKLKVLTINIISASFTVLGALLVSQLELSNTTLGSLLAVTAGVFFYLGVVDLLPHTFEEMAQQATLKDKVLKFVPVLVGAAILWASLLAVPHSHEHEEHDDHEHADEHADEHAADELILDENHDDESDALFHLD